MNDLNKNYGAEIIEMEQIILIHKDIRIFIKTEKINSVVIR